MKAVILAGGFGTRIMEETQTRPKPMIEIGGRPILWHIMRIYAHHGINEFIICCGYKGYMIKEYFSNYSMHQSDITFDMVNGQTIVHAQQTEPWKVTLVDTGDNSMTGGRLRRVRDHLEGEEPFCFTYGDGVADIDITAQIAFHKNHGKKATVAAVQPPGRYGALEIEGDGVLGFIEKPRGDGGLINGGFFILSPACIDEISGDDSVWEQEPLENLARQGELMAFRHKGFWQPMDTLREKVKLETLWSAGEAPWKVWA